LELRSGSGFHNILNQLICPLVWVRICLFPWTRRWTWVNIIFCAKKFKRSPLIIYLELSRLIFRCISTNPEGLSYVPRFFELF
jgi:hypothetical protein